MIPIRLTISGFLSYREKAEIDFTKFNLACISGLNGAGKSSLLDAITWALFGQARKRDDSVIHLLCDSADVSLIFAYEGNTYQVRRIKPRDKTMQLEFQILQEPEGGFGNLDANDQIASGLWKPLTERTMRETEHIIELTLRMDYETFINASFFLQGKADQFTQQRPGDRKRILGSILGLEIWDTYRESASEHRRLVERRISELDGQIKEIVTELDEEQSRLERLKDLEARLNQQEKLRAAQEALTLSARQTAVQIGHQKSIVDIIVRQQEATTRQLVQLESRLAERRQDDQHYNEQLKQAENIENAYNEWQKLRAELEQIEQTAAQFREFDKQREAPRSLIQEARARLEQERSGLLEEQQQAKRDENEEMLLLEKIENNSNELKLAQEQLAQFKSLEENLHILHSTQTELRAENDSLRPEMEKLKDRISRLELSDQAECPLCGQPLSQNDRLGLIERLQAEGQEKGDRHRANRARQQEIDIETSDLEGQITALKPSESEMLRLSNIKAQLETQLENVRQRHKKWLQAGSLRLETVEKQLLEEDFAAEARDRLSEIDRELKTIGYDAAMHDAVRQSELVGRENEVRMRALEQAQAKMEPLQREIADLVLQIKELQVEADRQKTAYDQAQAVLAEIQAKSPNLDEAENELLDIQEEENRLRVEVGAARQEVAVLEILKSRRQSIEEEREQLAKQSGQYRQLERAFGKDGVPALLIEQALPQIEIKANEILDRLSNGMMSVQFVTQAKFKDKSREDLKETMDIVIRDGAGKRDYELFSGGEAFRVNFAIRLALSEVLAQRAGARLQTLVIDEGFGSQDAMGRQRLIEAINLVRKDFAKVLVITHIDELKDVFPNRIEVEKTGSGSTAVVI